MLRSDRFSALFFLALAIYICQQAMEIEVGTLGQPGPGLLSFGAGAGIGLLALVLLIQTFMSGSHPEPKAETGRSGRTAIVVAISVSLFVYTLAVNWLGFILATLMFVFFLFRIVETESWWRSTIKAVLVMAGNYMLFVVWLGLRLPRGFLPW